MTDLVTDVTMDIHDNIVKHCLDAYTNNFRVEHAVISYKDYASLAASLGSKVQYIELREDNITLTGIRLITPTGPVNVVPDLNVSDNKATFFGSAVKPASFLDVLKNESSLKELK